MKSLQVLFLILFLPINILFAEEIKFEEASFYLKPLSTDYILGDKNAKITIIEYSNYACPHCAIFHTTIFNEIKSQYIDKGKIKWITRLFVSDGPSLKGAVLTQCFGDQKYYTILSILFNKQDHWAFGYKSDEFLKNIALLSGMDVIEFNNCMENKKIENFLLNQRIIAEKILKVRGTPAFYINGKETKIYNLESFKNAIKPYIMDE